METANLGTTDVKVSSIAFIDKLRAALIPRRAGRYGRLPPLLLGLTFVTGLVDAFSYLLLGHVFVANMTGNVVFLGFAIAGANGFSIPASLVALGSFALGALIGGKAGSGLGHHAWAPACGDDLLASAPARRVGGRGRSER